VSKSAIIRVVSMVSTAFVGLTAVGGGIALATGAEGNRFPLAWLKGTPFDSYLIPGLILAVVVGGSSAVAWAALWRNSRWAGAVTIVAATALTGQIIGELTLLGQPQKPTVTECVYLGIAAVMAAGGVLTLPRAQRGEDAH
jgi:hypothetical protein